MRFEFGIHAPRPRPPASVTPLQIPIHGPHSGLEMTTLWLEAARRCEINTWGKTRQYMERSIVFMSLGPLVHGAKLFGRGPGSQQ